jgi:cysteinyl-tRNA synthetase
MIAQAEPSNEKKLEDMSLNKKGELQLSLDQAEIDLKSALENSFDTPQAMSVIYGLIRAANTYIITHKASADIQDLEKVARWVTKIVGVFGLDANATPPYNGLGWAASPTKGVSDPKKSIVPYSSVYTRVTAAIKSLQIQSEALDKLLQANVDDEFETLVSTGSNDIETISMPYLRATSRLRDELRRIAPSSPSKKKILELCDQIRDQDLTDLGVYLDDRSEGQPSLIKFVPREELLAQREEKAAKVREEVARKEAARLAREKVEAEKKEKAKLSPVEMFKSDEKYSEWDSEGIPTKTKEGGELPKSALKKLRKDWERQKKLHEEYNKSN